MKRSVTVKLQASKNAERILFELVDTGAKAWNEVNYFRRQQFFNHEPVDFNKTEKTSIRNTRKKLAQQQFNKFAGKMQKHGRVSSL